MKEAHTYHKLAGQVRRSKERGDYKIISFSTDCFINYYCTWLIEYLSDGKRYYKPEILILKDKIIK
jgi:hypothetical protein